MTTVVEESTRSQRLTLRSLIGDLAEGRKSKLVHWPPDVFAKTAQALKVTGAYRHATNVDNKKPWPPDERWLDTVKEDAKRWWEWLLQPHSKSEGRLDVGYVKSLADYLDDLKEHADTPVDSFSFITEQAPEAAPAGEAVGKALLHLHALADQACCGFGVPSAQQGTLNVAHYLANSMLAETGSLSTLPRSEGLVLPKMRTAQVGLTLRSFSHHLTFHQTETEVVWRTLPWVNIDENTLNMLVIPWPFDVRATDFRPKLSLGRSRSVSSARFFVYSPTERFPETKVLEYIRAAMEHTGRVHMVVLPELALWEDELNRLKQVLVKHLPPHQVPLILTGIASDPEGHEKAGAASRASVKKKPDRNRVVLSAYFLGNWYDLDQDKHHRWKIDGKQIQQYGLGGMLTGGREWWEAIDVLKRRMSFLVPNGWFALAPLICEDLARLEPVSDLVRGVGPTLLIALLFDGPQLKERWSGRYASVLADDPGSSVLTVTALGMSKRSRIMKGTTTETKGSLGTKNVALWRDQERGWHEVVLPPDEDGKQTAEAALLTVTASWTEEFTADGRHDDGAAARFLLEGVEWLQPVEHGFQERKVQVGTKRSKDLVEVALTTYLADALLDANETDRERIAEWVLDDEIHFDRYGNLPAKLLRDRLTTRSPWRRENGAEEGRDEDEDFPLYKPAARILVERLRRFPLKDVQSETGDEALKRYKEVLADCQSRLRRIAEAKDRMTELKNLKPSGEIKGAPARDALRVEIGLSIVILWAIHKRISDRRRRGLLTSPWATLLEGVERQLQLPMDEWTRVYRESQY